MSLASFHRVRRSARPAGGAILAIYGLSLLASLAFVGLILLSGLFVELFSSGGGCEVDQARADSLESWAGPPSRTVNGRMLYTGAGLVPWAIRLEGTSWGGVSRFIVETFPSTRSNASCLTWLVALALALVALHAVCSYLLDRAVLAKVAECVVALRRAISTQAFQLGGAELPNRYEPAASELFSDRAESVRHGLAAWWRALPRMAMLAGLLLATALAIHAWLAIAAILLAYVCWTIYRWTERRTRRRRVLLSDRAAQQMSLLLEGLRKVRLARGLSLSEAPGQPVGPTLEQQRRAGLARDARESILEPLAFFLVLTAAVVVLAIAGANILRQPPRISFSAATVLYLALAAAWLPLRRLYRLRGVVQRAALASAAINQYLDREPKIGQLPQAVPVKRLARALSLENVTFSDGLGRRLLDEISLSIPAASTAAIVCTDPRAREALACLLGRFLDPAAGRVLYDDHELRTVTIESIRSQLALVMESDWLFTGTVTENITGGDPAYSEQQVFDAARKLHAYDAIQRLPQGFATIVGEHGLQLPALTQWRIALARALLRNPCVVIIEEPNGAIDGEAPPTMDDTLALFVKDRTAIYLPTRLSTLRGVDRVFVLHEGKVHAAGEHNDLLQQSELYRHWNYMRFNPFRP